MRQSSDIDAKILAELLQAGGPVSYRQIADSLAGTGQPAAPWFWWRVAGALERLASGCRDRATPVISFFYRGGWWYVHPDHTDRAALASARPSQEPAHALRDYWEHRHHHEKRGRGAAHRARVP